MAIPPEGLRFPSNLCISTAKSTTRDPFFHILFTAFSEEFRTPERLEAAVGLA